MSKVVKFYPKGSAARPDAVLEQAVGEFEKVAIIGVNTDGEVDLRASLNITIAEMHYFMAIASQMLVDHASTEMEAV